LSKPINSRVFQLPENRVKLNPTEDIAGSRIKSENPRRLGSRKERTVRGRLRLPRTVVCAIAVCSLRLRGPGGENLRAHRLR
jgi:hypothetical protein